MTTPIAPFIAEIIGRHNAPHRARIDAERAGVERVHLYDDRLELFVGASLADPRAAVAPIAMGAEPRRKPMHRCDWHMPSRVVNRNHHRLVGWRVAGS